MHDPANQADLNGSIGAPHGVDRSGIHSTHVGSFAVAPGPTADSAALQDARSHALTLASAIELLSQLDGCGSLVEAAEQSVLTLHEHSDAKNVALLWRDSDQRALSILAQNDRIDHRLPERHWNRLLIAAAEEVAARDDATDWPPGEASDAHSLLAVAQLAAADGTARIIAVSLKDANGETRGALIVCDARNEVLDLMRVLSGSLGAKLAGLEYLQPNGLESRVREITALMTGRKRRLVLAAVCTLIAMMFVPVKYRIGTDLELQPVKQRFVAVPFDAPLQKAHVRPGDLVQQGDLLATINPREIEFELAGTRAEWQRALQEKKGLMAEHDFAGSKIAELESEKLRLKADLLEFQRNNLEIRSPISGVIVSGDLDQSEGMPMTRGETLFEIAPLGEMIVELAVEESDFAHVRVGMPVSFYVHAFPDQQIEGTVEHVHPRAELRNHDNVYIAELRVLDPEQRLRPGMRGRARIVGERHPLGWNLFHKAYYAMRQNVGW